MMKISLRERKTRGGTRTLYLDYYEHGKRSLEYLKLYLTGDAKRDKQTLELAEQIRSKRVTEHAQGEHGFIQPTRLKDDFIAYCRAIGGKQRSPNTQLVWKHAVDHLEAFAAGYLPFARVTQQFLESFRDDHLLKKVNRNSARVYLARIQTALHKAVDEKILLSIPWKSVGIEKQNPKREFLDLRELKKLGQTECANQAVKDAFLFSSFSGLRYSDVKALTWEKVRKSGPHYSIEFIQQKTQEPEWMPLTRQAGKIIGMQKNKEYSANITSEVNPNAVFKLPAQQTIDKAIKRWVKRAGIHKRVSFHTARHSFATLGITRGVDIYTLSKLLGHKDITATQIYAKIIDEKKQQAVNLFPTL